MIPPRLLASGHWRPHVRLHRRSSLVTAKLQLVLFFEGLRSDRQLMRVVADRLSLRWYLGYDLAEPLPDHSSLTRIRERYGLDVFRRFFERDRGAVHRRGIGLGAGAVLRRHQGRSQCLARLARPPLRRRGAPRAPSSPRAEVAERRRRRCGWRRARRRLPVALTAEAQAALAEAALPAAMIGSVSAGRPDRTVTRAALTGGRPISVPVPPTPTPR